MILLVPNLEDRSVEWGCFINLEGNKASVFLNVSPDGYMHDHVTECGLGWVAPLPWGDIMTSCLLFIVLNPESKRN
jgi:hypothetical protein